MMSGLGITRDELPNAIANAVEEALGLWLAYRDGVARAMGLTKPDVERPRNDL